MPVSWEGTSTSVKSILKVVVNHAMHRTFSETVNCTGSSAELSPLIGGPVALQRSSSGHHLTASARSAERPPETMAMPQSRAEPSTEGTTFPVGQATPARDHSRPLVRPHNGDLAKKPGVDPNSAPNGTRFVDVLPGGNPGGPAATLPIAAPRAARESRDDARPLDVPTHLSSPPQAGPTQVWLISV
jgi:hypothetical protein